MEDPWLSQVADALQLSIEDLQGAIQDGKTIATLAQEKSMDLTTLVDTLVKSASDRYTQDVSSGKLTQEQADQNLSDLKKALSEWFTTGTMSDLLKSNRSIPELGLVADALGINEAGLQEALKNSKTLAELAKEKSISLDILISTVMTKRSETIKQEVTDGKLTQDEADKIISDLKTNLTEWYNTGTLPAAWQRGGGMRIGMDEIAKALGMTEDELNTALKANKTISQIAEGKSISLDILAGTLLTRYTDQLKKEVTDGKLTQTEADQKLATIKSDLVKQLESGNLNFGQNPDGVNTSGGVPGKPNGTPPASGPGLNNNRLTPAPTSSNS